LLFYRGYIVAFLVFLMVSRTELDRATYSSVIRIISLISKSLWISLQTLERKQENLAYSSSLFSQLGELLKSNDDRLVF